MSFDNEGRSASEFRDIFAKYDRGNKEAGSNDLLNAWRVSVCV